MDYEVESVRYHAVGHYVAIVKEKAYIFSWQGQNRKLIAGPFGPQELFDFFSEAFTDRYEDAKAEAEAYRQKSLKAKQEEKELLALLKEI